MAHLRRLTILLLLLLFAPIASAACNSSMVCDTQDEAWQKVKEQLQSLQASQTSFYAQYGITLSQSPITFAPRGQVCNTYDGYIGYVLRDDTHDSIGGRQACYVNETQCPATQGGVPRKFNTETGACTPTCPSPGDIYNDTQDICQDPNQWCVSQNTPGMDEVRTLLNMPSGGRCVGGCMLRPISQTATVCVKGTTNCTTSGVIRFTGACSDSNPPPIKPEDIAPSTDQCIKTAGAPDTCVRNNTDRICYTASSGREICWTPGETGSKSDENTQQERNAGPTPIAPIMQLPNGDSLQQSTDPVTTVTTINNTTITTTTTNYTTVNGTNSPAPPAGTNTGEPPKDKEGTSASGGGDCTSPPAITGDPALAMIAMQAWNTRCAVETLNEPNPDGHDSGAALTGTDQEDAAARDGAKQNDTIGVEGLDQSGLGLARTCPAPITVDVFDQHLQLTVPQFCDWMQLGGALLILVATLLSLRMIAGAV